MARITISEQDLTVRDYESTTANVVYVPGIANQGPVNEPTLCESMTDFIEIFGDQPYIFHDDQIRTEGGVDVTYAQAGDFEKSYIYAAELLKAGLPVLFERVVETLDPAEVTDDHTLINQFYGALRGQLAQDGSIETESVFNKLQDKWIYNIKFITAGGYGVLEDTAVDNIQRPIVEMMCMVAALRGDCVALIDHRDGITSIMDIYNDVNDNVIGYVNGNTTAIDSWYTLKSNVVDEQLFTITYSTPANRLSEVTAKYGQICSPWGIYTTLSEQGIAATESATIRFPGSFAYLKSFANSVIKYKNPNYFAIAGVVRGLVPSLNQTVITVTGAEAEAVQERTKDKISINPIVGVQGYGLCIWGNRTLFPNTSSSENPSGELSASSFLNIRVMAADVKKVIYAACKKYTFETNNTELWLKFKSDVEPTLEKMVANGGLEDYELQRKDTSQRATLSVYVKLYTLYAVEDFDITIALTDSTVEQAQ